MTCDNESQMLPDSVPVTSFPNLCFDSNVSLIAFRLVTMEPKVQDSEDSR
jgi:hypothetical protein